MSVASTILSTALKTQAFSGANKAIGQAAPLAYMTGNAAIGFAKSTSSKAIETLRNEFSGQNDGQKNQQAQQDAQNMGLSR